MFQITADLSALTAEQRQAVAAFILAFPQNNNHVPEVIGDSESVTFTGLVAQSEEDEQSPEEVFGAILSPVTAFGLAAIQDAKIAALPGPVLVPTQAATSIAPVVAVSPALPTDGAAVLDKNGLPWDGRIHAGSKVTVADGSWRIKRGVDPALIATVEAELKALMAIPTVAAFPPPPPPAPATDTPAAPVALDMNAFVSLLTRTSSLIQTNKITQAEMESIVTSFGVPSLTLLAHRLDLVPQVSSKLDAIVSTR